MRVRTGAGCSATSEHLLAGSFLHTDGSRQGHRESPLVFRIWFPTNPRVSGSQTVGHSGSRGVLRVSAADLSTDRPRALSGTKNRSRSGLRTALARQALSRLFPLRTAGV